MGNNFMLSGTAMAILIVLGFLGLFFVATVVAAIVRSAKQRRMEREQRFGNIEQVVNGLFVRVDALEQKRNGRR